MTRALHVWPDTGWNRRPDKWWHVELFSLKQARQHKQLGEVRTQCVSFDMYLMDIVQHITVCDIIVENTVVVRVCITENSPP